MSGIVRADKRGSKNYSVVANYGLQDPRLSFQARGLLGYLLTKPDDWELRIDDLIATGTDGLTAVRSALKELTACGYVKREKLRDAEGKIVWTTTIFERPQEPETDPKIPAKTVEPSAEKPSVENLPMEGETIGRFSVDGKPADILSTELLSTEYSSLREEAGAAQKQKTKTQNGSGNSDSLRAGRAERSDALKSPKNSAAPPKEPTPADHPIVLKLCQYSGIRLEAHATTMDQRALTFKAAKALIADGVSPPDIDECARRLRQGFPFSDGRPIPPQEMQKQYHPTMNRTELKPNGTNNQHPTANDRREAATIGHLDAIAEGRRLAAELRARENSGRS